MFHNWETVCLTKQSE